MDIRSFEDGDGDALRTFWINSHIAIRPGDDDRSLAQFARKNQGLFLIAFEHRRIVGSILAGWDGRRGWLYHVATHPDERRRGIATTLVRQVEASLKERGCPKINLIVVDTNTWGRQFWEAIGYKREATVEYAKEL